ncbi:MAG: diguanylate cyclase [Planctomycetes bacterium]|nr:diguanylate cyclase [Planctomycetota bacterium]
MRDDVDKSPSSNSVLLAPPADSQVAVLSSLLETLDEVALPHVSPRARADATHQNHLAQVRLGMASSLFVALRAKHPRTASHSLRVALTCSSWSSFLELTDEHRDELEVAGLLHDIGKIGVPDHVLLKPGKLSADEAMLMDRHREHVLEILACFASQRIMDTVYLAPAWYDGRSHEFDRKGQDLPLGSRILAVADAFDAMTTDHVYRRAMSRERAMAELFAYADTQFDPELVKNFSAFLVGNHDKLAVSISRRWLHDVADTQPNERWRLSAPLASQQCLDINSQFHEQLLDSMENGVVFVDARLKILKWNRAVELLAGVSAASAEQQHWDPAMLRLRDENHKLVPPEKCPVINAIKAGACLRQRLFIADAKGDNRSVDAYAAPVLGSDGSVCGATLLLQDTSSQVTLERRVQRLNEKVKQDALTGAANRAGLDRAHQQFTRVHLERGTPYSLIICDLDFFKKVNDTFGHPAGDEALIAFSSLLKRYCPNGGLVARYGGEEFVLLCPDCDNSQTTELAERVRRAWAETPHAVLDGKCITASLGVTELQLGDTSETMLRRADRALLQAKNDGRNTVVQLGAGMASEQQTRDRPSGWLSWFKGKPVDQVLERSLITTVPLKLAAEKLRGFVFDQGAEIVEISDENVTLEIDGRNSVMMQRSGDRATPFLIELRLEETRLDAGRTQGTNALRTLAHVTIRPKRQRDRRRRDVVERARQLLCSLKSYLMAQDHSVS